MPFTDRPLWIDPTSEEGQMYDAAPYLRGLSQFQRDQLFGDRRIGAPKSYGEILGNQIGKQAQWNAQPIGPNKEPGLEEQFPQLDLAMLATLPGSRQAVKAGARGVGDALAGMGERGAINWPSGEVLPNAFLHRSLTEAELPFWERLFARGRSSQAPTTAVGPNLLSVFGNNPRGLLFNVEAPEAIKYAAPNPLCRQIQTPDLSLAGELERRATGEDVGESVGGELDSKLGRRFYHIL